MSKGEGGECGAESGGSVFLKKIKKLLLKKIRTRRLRC
jgi:hypothetical protein